MNLHDKTKIKIKQLFDMGNIFCETQSEKYIDRPDVIFIVSAFEKAFGEFSFKLRLKKDYDIELYHDEIFNLDNILSSWREHLVYRLPDDSDKGNDLYSVLFSVLQGVDTIIDEDHFYWEEDEEDEEITNEEDNYDLEPDIHLSSHDDDDYLERTF